MKLLRFLPSGDVLESPRQLVHSIELLLHVTKRIFLDPVVFEGWAAAASPTSGWCALLWLCVACSFIVLLLHLCLACIFCEAARGDLYLLFRVFSGWQHWVFCTL